MFFSYIGEKRIAPILKGEQSSFSIIVHYNCCVELTNQHIIFLMFTAHFRMIFLLGPVGSFPFCPVYATLVMTRVCGSEVGPALVFTNKEGLEFQCRLSD